MTSRISAWTGLAALLTMLTGVAHAQSDGIRIGVVNVPRLLEQAPQAQGCDGATARGVRAASA